MLPVGSSSTIPLQKNGASGKQQKRKPDAPRDDMMGPQITTRGHQKSRAIQEC